MHCEDAPTPAAPARLARFLGQLEDALAAAPGEEAILARAAAAMRELVAVDDWLPEASARPHPQYYQQHLLHLDPQGRYSVVSFVWGPGQRTPIHDHTVWGVIGMLRGRERGQSFSRTPQGMVPEGEAEVLEPGDVACVSPAIGDIHEVSNALDDAVSISIHVYGADIGQVRRHVYDRASGAAKEFVSGYSGGPRAAASVPLGRN